MGKINLGILGAISGKVGPVVGARWNGIDTLRSYQPNISDPQTESQLSQRNKFSVVVSFCVACLSIIKIGLCKYTDRITPYSKAVSENIKNAVEFVSDEWRIKYSDVVLSLGTLTELANAGIGAYSLGSLAFTWENNTGYGNQSSDDKVYLVVYSAYYNTAIYSDAHVRSSVGGSINIPSDWEGTEVETFVFAVSNDGVLISNTQYTGYKELT